MTTFLIEPQYLFKFASMVRGFNTSQSVGYRCNVPLYTISVDFLGNCLLCDCDGWLPLPIGTVQDFDSIQSLLTSDKARFLQKDVSQGHFSYCAVDNCGIRLGNKIKNKVTLSINIDESCNLACPSCRRDHMMLTQGPDYEKKKQDVARIVQWLSIYDDPIHVVLTGNGDPLASHVIRHLIFNWQIRPHQTFTLKTNGLLIKKMLAKLAILDQITDFSISVDAGSESVYENVRRPGKWVTLVENLEFLREEHKNSMTGLNFALQKNNFRDIPAFVALCETYGMTGRIHNLDDWGTWSTVVPETPDVWTIKNGVFADHDVLNTNHPNHNEVMRIVRQFAEHPTVQMSPVIKDRINKSNAVDI